MLPRYDLFVSHATRPDPDARELVDAVVTHLRCAGLSVFLDRDCGSSGAAILPFLDDAIERSDAALLVHTARAAASGWVAVERERLRERHRAGGFPVMALCLEPGCELPGGFDWLGVINASGPVPRPEDVAREALDWLQKRSRSGGRHRDVFRPEFVDRK